MATFPSIEASYGLRKNSAPKIRVVKFADGYEHRINLGLSEHQNPKDCSNSASELEHVAVA